MFRLVHYETRMASKRLAEPFASSGLIFNNYNHSRCLPQEKTSKQFETMTTLTVNSSCVSSDKVSVFLLR